MSQNPTRPNFGSKLAQFVISYKWLVLIGGIALAAFLAYGLNFAGFNNDYRVFFSEENPQLKAFDALQAKYTKDDNVYIVIEPKGGEVFDRSVLSAIEELVDSAWQTPYSSRVDAITNYQHTIAIDDDMYVDDLISDIGNRTDIEILKAKQIALNEPLLKKRLINEDGSISGINVVVKKPDQSAYYFEQAAKRAEADSLGLEVKTFLSAEEEIAYYLRNKTEEIEKKYPNVKTYLSGVVMLSNAFGEAANKDLSTLVPAMYLVIILTLIILTLIVAGNIKGLSGKLKIASTALSVSFSTVVILLLSILGAIGAVSWCGVQMTSVSVSAPTMILTLAVADSIHIIISFLQSMRKGLAKNDAIVESLRINFSPVLITSLTTVVGFLTMNFSDSPPFKDLGNAAAIGVGLAFLFSVTVLPALLSILPAWVNTQTKKTPSTALLTKLANFSIFNRRALLWGTTGFIILMIFLATRNELNEQFVSYFDHDIAFRTDTDFMNENITGIYNIEYSVNSGEVGGINNPQFLQTLEEFEHWFEQKEKVVHVNTYGDVARKVNKSMHGDDERYYRMPDSREEAAQYLLLYEMSLPFGLDLNNQINVDKSETRFTVTVDNISAKELIQYSDDGKEWLAQRGFEPSSNIGIGTSIMFAHLTQRQIYSMAEGGVWALILITIVLMIALRSPKFGLLSMIPNIVPLAIAFGFWYLFNGQITSGLAVVFSMTIGIVVDDTVHLFSKYLRARREMGFSSEDAIRYAFSTVGMAIITTTVVLSAGFLILGQSSFGLNSGMAQLTALTIIIALVIDLLFLPSLILMIDKSRHRIETAKDVA